VRTVLQFLSRALMQTLAIIYFPAEKKERKHKEKEGKKKAKRKKKQKRDARDA